MDATQDNPGSGGYQDSSASTPVPAQPVISNAANAAVSASQQPGMQQQAPPQTQPAPPEHHNAIVSILRAVGDALGGGSTIKRVNPQTGVIEEVPRSTGSKVGSAVTTLLRGAAAGAAQHGPGSVGASALAGANAQDQFQQQQQQRLMQESQNVRDTNEQTMRQQLAQASLAKSNQDMVRTALDIKAANLKFDADQAALINELGTIRSIPGAQLIGHFDSNADINKYLAGAGDAASKQHAVDFARNLIRAVPSPNGGFDAYQLPIRWQDQTIGDGHTLSIMSTTMGRDGKPVPVWKTVPAPATMTWGEFVNWQSSTLKASTDNDLKALQVKHEKAGIEHEQAETQLTDLNIKDKQQWLNLSQSGDLFGDPIGDVGSRSEYNKRVDTFSKDYGKDLNQLDQASSQLRGIIKNAQKTGKLPGADSVVGLFDAIGISSAPLKGRGFRINNEIVGEHKGARNILQDMATKLQKVSPNGTGQVVTLQQLQDYSRILDQARHDAYLGAADVSRQNGIGVRVVPQGHNTPADGSTVKLFLDIAGGNVQKATKALQASGWQVNP